MNQDTITVEHLRLDEHRGGERDWKHWGPYLSDRAWGTVREDYSPDGRAWDYLTHDESRSVAYRWNEDGIAGICDRRQRICFAVALWNGADPILKERLFGLSGSEGNHGEDVKECYYYLDSTPTHTYMKALYKYPQAPFPYEELLQKNRQAGIENPEFELVDTGIFDEGRYFDVLVEYAKSTPEEVLIRITVSNRGPEKAVCHLLPTLWLRNLWSWGYPEPKGALSELRNDSFLTIKVENTEIGSRWLCCEGEPELLFTENETNFQRLYGSTNASPYVKDAFHDYLIHKKADAVNPGRTGTKGAAHYILSLNPGESGTVKLRLLDNAPGKKSNPFGKDFDKIFNDRIAEADLFYSKVFPADLSEDGRNVMRQALAGMLWSKQYYHYVVQRWLDGDPAFPPPPPERLTGRNHDWRHVYAADVISMPDKWEYPWFAAWDLAFHCIALSIVDSDFAKEQLVLLLREWYMHPNGQQPAYEWAFDDVNPPVHAWSCWRVYQIERKRRGYGDLVFLERVFHKLMLNFTWWVNRKDMDGNNVFQGGFLGLDNIGVFDRSAPLPFAGHIEQADGTAWMAAYCLNMLNIAIELAKHKPAYEDVATKFLEHFLYIAAAMDNLGGLGFASWDNEDGFFYDVLHLNDGRFFPMKVRSMVGLIPLFAVETLEPAVLEKLPEFRKRLEWFLASRPDLMQNVASMKEKGQAERRLLSIVDKDILVRVLQKMLDESEFLSDHGIRALSKFYEDHPYDFPVSNADHWVAYEPAESRTCVFGGNSNWRGPIWFPANYLIIESLQKYDYYYGESLKVEFPTGSGTYLTLWEVASELSRRLSGIFLRDEHGARATHGGDRRYSDDPNWKDLVLFYEYFHGDNGKGLGASHQTGWTGIVAKLLQQSGDKRPRRSRSERQTKQL